MGEPDSIGSGNDKVRALTFDKETVQKVGKTFDPHPRIRIDYFVPFSDNNDN